MAAVVNAHAFAQNYRYDKKEQLWCELTFGLPATSARIDLTSLVRDTAQSSVLHQVEQVKRAVTYRADDGRLLLRTDGINIAEMFRHDTLLDLNKLYCNDIHRVAATYGIEAARRVIVREVQDVFRVYGIAVDPRHLLLIADYMTYGGVFEPMSRRGMEGGASPLQQMSFESSLGFLRAAALGGRQDHLGSPSACLMLGKPPSTGTGAFSLRQKIHPLSVA